MSDIPKTMRAVVYRGVNDLRLETVPVPRIGPNELLVKVAACGVCPTDIKKIQSGTVPPPRIFGHETAGTIIRIGGGAGVLASRFKPGDRVALHHHVPCRDCHFCRHRAFAQCETYKRTGITAGFEPAGGGYAEYVRVLPFVLPGVVKIPAQNSFAEGAMLEPVNTVLKAVRRLSLLRGDVVLVAGQGPIGLMFTRLLQLAGAQVIATDLLEPRLRLARKFGAKWTMPAQTGRAELLLRHSFSKSNSGGAELPLRPDARQRVPTSTLIHRATRGGGLDAAVIAVPSDAVVQQALQLVRGGGQVLLFAHTKRFAPEGGNQRSRFSLQPSAFSLDLASVCLDEKDLLGSYSSDFTLQDEVARLVFSRQLDVRSLITHRFPLEQTAEAVALAAHPTPDSLKIIVGGTACRRP
ncbi:MAG: alcohol dehydrogenase catalytic domain-containing protein [Verrucomicrobiia bacterium]